MSAAVPTGVRRAFVTGGTGFLGLNLIEQLTERGWRVTALHRASSDLEELRRFDAQLVEGDITDDESLRAAMPEEVDAVFHLAANTSLWSQHNDRQTRDNVKGTHGVVSVALEKRARRLVHTSSIAAYGIHNRRIDETASQRPATLSWINYLSTKALAETIVRWGIDKGLDAVILNPANLVGPYARTGWGRVIRSIHRGKLPGLASGRASFCHSREVARAHIAAAEREDLIGENFLLGGVDASYKEFVRTVGRVIGCEKNVPRWATPYPLLWLAARLQARRAAETGRAPMLTPERARLASCTMTCDSSKAERELGYRGKNIPLERMVEDSFRWLEARRLV